MALALAAVGCRQLNASHCGNQQGDLTCEQRNAATPYCDRCEAANDGCVATPALEPGCGQGTSGGVGSTTAATTAADEGSSGTSTSTGAADSSSTGEPDLCGNGVIDEGEACDGELLPEGTTCQTAGDFGEGTPGCTDDCSAIDYTDCPLYTLCGNDEVGFGEQCDGTVFGGGVGGCGDLPNFTGEGLVCTDECTFDTSACMACIEHGEDCDPMGDVGCCDEGDICGPLMRKCCTPGPLGCLL